MALVNNFENSWRNLRIFSSSYVTLHVSKDYYRLSSYRPQSKNYEQLQQPAWPHHSRIKKNTNFLLISRIRNKMNEVDPEAEAVFIDDFEAPDSHVILQVLQSKHLYHTTTLRIRTPPVTTVSRQTRIKSLAPYYHSKLVTPHLRLILVPKT